MGKYLKEFQNHTEYTAYTADTESFILPNVSYCIEQNEVHYNPYNEPSQELVLTATYNVEDASEPTLLYAYYAEEGQEEWWVRGVDMFNKIEIDGVEVDIEDIDADGGTYNLGVGTHTVNYTLKDNTIKNWGFVECSNLTSVDISDGVTSIGEGAFDSCYGLSSITLSDSVTSIGDEAFEGCISLTSVTIPDSVTNIGESTFSWCTSLTNITIPSVVTSIGYEAFYETPWWNSYSQDVNNQYNGVVYINDVAYKTVSTSITSVEFRENTRGIGGGAFQGCTSLTSITIPSSVISIGERAFEGCNGLTSITIPSGVTRIGYMEFASCTNLTSITVDSNNSVYDSRDNCNAIIETSTNKLIQGCANTTIPSNITSIGDEAFCGHSNLRSITIPSGVTRIGSNAFDGCGTLTSITIPNNSQLASIGGAAFQNCYGLTSINIPSGVTSIGESAFNACRSLTSITIPSGVTSIGDGVFYNCLSLTSITIPSSVTSIGVYAFYGCSGLTSVTFAEGSMLNSIGNYAFQSCSGLTSINIPSGVTSIGEWAFLVCRSLSNVTCLPTVPPTLGSGAFNYNASGRKIYVPLESVNAYKAATNWSNYSSDIEPIGGVPLN